MNKNTKSQRFRLGLLRCRGRGRRRKFSVKNTNKPIVGWQHVGSPTAVLRFRGSCARGDNKWWRHRCVGDFDRDLLNASPLVQSRELDRWRFHRVWKWDGNDGRFKIRGEDIWVFCFFILARDVLVAVKIAVKIIGRKVTNCNDFSWWAQTAECQQSGRKSIDAVIAGFAASRVRCEVDTPDCLLILAHNHARLWTAALKESKQTKKFRWTRNGRWRRHRRGEPICGRSDNTFFKKGNHHSRPRASMTTIKKRFDGLPGSEPTATDLDLRCRSNNVVVVIGHLK